MTQLKISESIHVAATPEALYALVSDITRMGEWSPVNTGGWWDEGDGPQVGAWFTGCNETPGRVWETRAQVVTADPGRAFAWEVNHGWVYWGYSMEPDGEGATLTETWEFTDKGIAGFHEKWGDEAEEQIELRRSLAEDGIPATLAAIKKTAEQENR